MISIDVKMSAEALAKKSEAVRLATDRYTQAKRRAVEAEIELGDAAFALHDALTTPADAEAEATALAELKALVAESGGR